MKLVQIHIGVKDGKETIPDAKVAVFQELHRKTLLVTGEMVYSSLLLLLI